MQILVGEGWSK